MSRHRHPHPAIERAIKYAESRGWEVRPAGKSSHAWGRLYCPYNQPGTVCTSDCVSSIYGTPSSPEDHAKLIRKRVDRCVGGRQSDAISEE